MINDESESHCARFPSPNRSQTIELRTFPRRAAWIEGLAREIHLKEHTSLRGRTGVITSVHLLPSGPTSRGCQILPSPTHPQALSELGRQGAVCRTPHCFHRFQNAVR